MDPLGHKLNAQALNIKKTPIALANRDLSTRVSRRSKEMTLFGRLIFPTD